MLPGRHHPSCRSTTCGCLSIPHPTASRCISHPRHLPTASRRLPPLSFRKHPLKTKQGASISSSPCSPRAVRLLYFRGAGGKPGLHGAEASKPAGKGDGQRGSPVFKQRQGQTVQVAAIHRLPVGRCSICSRPAFRPVPTQAEGKADAPPPQTHALLGQRGYLKFKGCSEQIKGEKNIDTICPREANCKQFCYSAAFYLNADTDRSYCWGTAQALGAHGSTEAESAQSPFFCSLEAGSRRKINQGGCRDGYLHVCCLTFPPAYLFLLSLWM